MFLSKPDPSPRVCVVLFQYNLHASFVFDYEEDLQLGPWILQPSTYLFGVVIFSLCLTYLTLP